MTGDDQAAPPCAATGCTRPAAPVLCDTDTRRLGDWLAQLGTEFELLSAVPSMQGREPGTGGAGGLASHRAPARLDALVLRDRRSRARDDDDPDSNGGRGVYEILASWASTVREERNLALPAAVHPPCPTPCMHRSCWSGVGRAWPLPRTVLSERALLAAHLDWIVGQDWAGEFFDEIRALWGLLRAANGHATPRPRVRCREDGCTGSVRWSDGAAVCGACGKTTRGPELLRVAAEEAA